MKEYKEYTIEELEDIVTNSVTDWYNFRGVTNISDKYEDSLAAFAYYDVEIILYKINPFRFMIIGHTTENGIDAIYRIDTDARMMVMLKDDYQQNRSSGKHLSGPLLTDVLGQIKQVFYWINRPIHIDADEDISKRKTLDDFFDLLKSGKLFEGEMEVNDDDNE